MTHDEFVSGYRFGRLAVHVDRSRAMRVCDRKDLIPKRYYVAH